MVPGEDDVTDDVGKIPRPGNVTGDADMLPGMEDTTCDAGTELVKRHLTGDAENSHINIIL